MSKLNVLYNVIRTMKEQTVFEGQADVELKYDKDVLGTVNGTFLKDKENGRCEKSVKVQMGTEEYKFEHEGKMKFEGKGCAEGHGHGFMFHGKGHGNHGNCGHGPKGKMGHFMMMLKVLDKMQATDLEDGRKLLSIQFEGDEIPKECLGMIHHKMKMHHENGGPYGHGKMKGMFEQCPCKDIDKETIKPEKIELQMFVSKDNKILSKTALIELSGKDHEGESHLMSLEVNIDMK